MNPSTNISQNLRKKIKRSIKDIKNLERKYHTAFLSYIEKTTQKLSDELLSSELPGGGWRHDFFPGPPSPLNTGEIGVALTNTITNDNFYKLGTSLSKLIDLLHDDGYWQTSHSPREGRFANAFGTNYLLKAYGISKYEVIITSNRLENETYNILELDHIHNFSCYCQSVKTLANVYKYGLGSEKLKDSLKVFKNQILKYQDVFWEKKMKEIKDLKKQL